VATVSKRLRYEILRRDNYACRYCGRSAPEVKLTVDAVVPEALGGSHKDPANLVAACADCNSGKTSTSPDAPLVADVAQDAFRWSQAMTVAAQRLQEDVGRREAAYADFDGWWGTWTCGPDKQPLPRPDNWRNSIDSFLAAGLPLDVLRWCVNRAMGSRADPSQTWRYMCGVAWRRARELQDTARRLTDEGDASGVASSAGGTYDDGRGDFARELLAELGDDEREHFLAQSDMSEYQDEDDEPQTETQIACEAISSALNGVRCDWDHLARRVEEFLQDLPDGIGDRALAPREDKLAAMCGPCSRRTFHLTEGISIAQDLLSLPAARSYLSALPEAERAEWHAYAAALYDRARLDEDRLISRAAYCARVIRDGQRWDVMCIGGGASIPVCPRRGTYHARIADAACCAPDGPEGHKGHFVCETHLEELIEGTYTGKGGRTFSATDYTAASTDAWDF
jgi:hypothetical protein